MSSTAPVKGRISGVSLGDAWLTLSPADGGVSPGYPLDAPTVYLYP